MLSRCRTQAPNTCRSLASSSADANALKNGAKLSRLEYNDATVDLVTLAYDPKSLFRMSRNSYGIKRPSGDKPSIDGTTLAALGKVQFGSTRGRDLLMFLWDAVWRRPEVTEQQKRSIMQPKLMIPEHSFHHEFISSQLEMIVEQTQSEGVVNAMRHEHVS
jgi:hypothetical protein